MQISIGVMHEAGHARASCISLCGLPASRSQAFKAKPSCFRRYSCALTARDRLAELYIDEELNALVAHRAVTWATETGARQPTARHAWPCVRAGCGAWP
jgi:hypothetical protein